MPHQPPANPTPEQQARYDRRHPTEAENQAKHEAMLAQRKAANDQSMLGRAWAYFSSLDDSHKYAFCRSNPRIAQAFVSYTDASRSEVNRIEGGSAYQTTDLQPIDPTVTEPAFAG